MNITEFAQYAGVSKAAVSRYFNGGYLGADKRALIEAAVEATGYHPSMQAQMLRTRRTRQVGVILPKLSSDSCPRIVEGIGSVLEDSGYQLLLINTANDPQKELRALDTLHQRTVDGILLIATVFTPEHKAVLERLHSPLVVLGQKFPGCCSVYHDDFGAAQAVTAHMLAKGRRAPGYIGVILLDEAAGQQRRAGFEQAARLLERDPHIDCLFCATDGIALGAMQYCREHGIRIPEDLMIAAVGDSKAGRNAFVPLTSAHLHYKTEGKDAAALLMELLNDPHAIPRSQMLGYELVCRESTDD